MPIPDSFKNRFVASTSNNPLRGGMVNLRGNIEQDMDSMGLPSNPEGYAMMGLTYAAAFTEGSTIGRTIGSIDDVVVTVKYPRNYLPEYTEAEPAAIVRGPNARSGDTPTYIPTKGTAEDYGDYGRGNIASCPDPEYTNMFNTIVTAHADWIGLFFILLGSAEPQDLTAKHFKSFFAWKRTPDIEGQILAKHFPSITGGMPTYLDDDEMRKILPKSKWIEYRTTFSSGGLLIAKMLRECPPAYLGVFSEETMDKIRAFENAKHSEALYRAIPEKALGIGYAYLMMTDQLVENLWGPRRSYEGFTVQEKESLKNWFTEARSKMVIYRSGVAGVGKTAMPAGVWGV